jgi:hypothetical protein
MHRVAHRGQYCRTSPERNPRTQSDARKLHADEKPAVDPTPGRPMPAPDSPQRLVRTQFARPFPPRRLFPHWYSFASPPSGLGSRGVHIHFCGSTWRASCASTRVDSHHSLCGDLCWLLSASCAKRERVGSLVCGSAMIGSAKAASMPSPLPCRAACSCRPPPPT